MQICMFNFMGADTQTLCLHGRPVNGQGFQNTKSGRQSGIFNKFDLSKSPSQSKLSYVN